MILRLDDALSSIPSQFSMLKKHNLADISAEGELSEIERCSLWESEERAEAQKACFPDGTRWEIEGAVSAGVLKLGKLFVDEVYLRAKDSINMDCFGQVQLLEMCIPWLGYNTLAINAQTHIMDKFYFVFCWTYATNAKN